MFPRESIPLDQSESFIAGEFLPQQIREITVDLDGDDISALREQFFGKGTGTRANLDHDVARRDRSRLGDEANEVLVDHEILAEPLPRRTPDLGQHCLDVMFALRHGGSIRRGAVDAIAASAGMSSKPA